MAYSPDQQRRTKKRPTAITPFGGTLPDGGATSPRPPLRMAPRDSGMYGPQGAYAATDTLPRTAPAKMTYTPAGAYRRPQPTLGRSPFSAGVGAPAPSGFTGPPEPAGYADARAAGYNSPGSAKARLEELNRTIQRNIILKGRTGFDSPERAAATQELFGLQDERRNLRRAIRPGMAPMQPREQFEAGRDNLIKQGVVPIASAAFRESPGAAGMIARRGGMGAVAGAQFNAKSPTYDQLVSDRASRPNVVEEMRGPAAEAAMAEVVKRNQVKEGLARQQQLAEAQDRLAMAQTEQGIRTAQQPVVDPAQSSTQTAAAAENRLREQIANNTFVENKRRFAVEDPTSGNVMAQAAADTLPSIIPSIREGGGSVEQSNNAKSLFENLWDSWPSLTPEQQDNAKLKILGSTDVAQFDPSQDVWTRMFNTIPIPQREGYYNNLQIIKDYIEHMRSGSFGGRPRSEF